MEKAIADVYAHDDGCLFLSALHEGDDRLVMTEKVGRRGGARRALPRPCSRRPQPGAQRAPGRRAGRAGPGASCSGAGGEPGAVPDRFQHPPVVRAHDTLMRVGQGRRAG